MKNNIFIALALISAVYQGWNSLSHDEFTTIKADPLYAEPYVVVYGRESCGLTQQTMKDLRLKNIPFKFKVVDDKAVANVLHSRMRSSGIDTRRYNLPVVDVNNNISIRPSSGAISQIFYK